MMADIVRRGRLICPIFMSPWFKTTCCRVDWLHCCDQGVAADFQGSVWWKVLRLLPGRSRKIRCTALWAEVQAFYEAKAIGDRLQGLTVGMIKQQKKWPKLRCLAAQCRALVPFTHGLISRYFAGDTPVEESLRVAAGALNACYDALSNDSIFAEDILRTESSKFALQFCALETVEPDTFRLKPKLHLFLHVCSDGGKPARTWTYRDEDSGGTVAAYSHRRGGLLSVSAFSGNLLDRVRMQPFPRVIPQ